MDSEDALVVFQGKQIRRTWHDNQWYFSVVGVISILTDSPTPGQYRGSVKDRAFKKLELSPVWVQLKSQSPDGKYYRNGLRKYQKPHHNIPEPQIPYSCTRSHSNTRWKFRTAAGWSSKPLLPKGTRVVLFVVRESPDDFSDLTKASESTLEFWDNPIDCEE